MISLESMRKILFYYKKTKLHIIRSTKIGRVDCILFKSTKYQYFVKKYSHKQGQITI